MIATLGERCAGDPAVFGRRTQLLGHVRRRRRPNRGTGGATGCRRRRQARPAVGDDRVERPGQPDDLCHLCLPEAVRLPQGEGAEADATGARGGARGRVVGDTGADGARRRPLTRSRPVGHLVPGLAVASIKRKGDVIRLKLEPEERMVLSGFAREVSELLGGVAAADPDPLAAMVGMGSETPTAAPDDPALRRLLPDAYDDPAGAAEFRRLTDDELRRGKTSSLTRLADDVEGSDGTLEIDNEAADIWVQALNDVRLVLGVRLKVEDDAGNWRRALTPDDPRKPLIAAYDWLAGVQEMLLSAMRR